MIDLRQARRLLRHSNLTHVAIETALSVRTLRRIRNGHAKAASSRTLEVIELCLRKK